MTPPHSDHVDWISEQWRRERPDLDTSPVEVIGRLHRLALALTAEIVPVYAEFGLSEPEFDLLASLRRSGAPYELPAGELSDYTMVTTGGLSKRVDRLEARGLVERIEPEDDRRRRMIRLTPDGIALIDAAFTAHMANEHRLIQQLGAADATALEPILRRWLALLSP
jgi:DNA-binding MarR family transcriptional regulator